MNDDSVDAQAPIDATEAAALAAEEVLKAEWGTVKAGEEAYRDAVRTTQYTLRTSFTILALLVIGYPIYYWTASHLETKAVKAQNTAVDAAAKVAAPTPAPAAAPATMPAIPISK